MFKYLEKNKKLLVYTPLIVYWSILFFATTLPATSMPSIGIADKINHLAAYFILSILLFLTLLFQKKYSLTLKSVAVYTFVICAVYGLVDETHQMFIPGRFAELLDWIADSAGSLAGILLMFFVAKKFKYQMKVGE